MPPSPADDIVPAMTWGRVALAGVLVAVAAAGTAAAAGRTWHPPLKITPRGAEPGDPSAAWPIRCVPLRSATTASDTHNRSS